MKMVNILDAHEAVMRVMKNWISSDVAYAMDRLGFDKFNIVDLSSDINHQLDECQTEAEPIRHAHWKRASKKHPHCMCCSACDFIPPDLSETQDLYDNMYAVETFDFCPGCGAMMGKEDENK